MPYDPSKQIDQLINLYREGFLNVLETLQVKESRGQVTVFYKDQLKQIMAILQDLDGQTADWIKDVVPKIYKADQREVMALIQKLGMQRDIRPEFAQIHKRAIDAAAQNMQNNLRDALQFAGRRVDDEYRRISMAAAGAKITAGRTVKDMAKDLKDRLTAKGLPGLRDRRGRVWSLDRYALMVARTTTRELGSIATQNTCAEMGLDYVFIPPHPTDDGPDDICLKYANKVFCISGNDPKYPKFTEDCRPPYHPNCRHTLQPYVPAIRDMTEEEMDELIKEAPEILNKIGYQMPPQGVKPPADPPPGDKKPDPGAAGQKTPGDPAAAAANNKTKGSIFDLDTFRKEIRALDPLPRYKKIMDQAKELIKKEIEPYIKVENKPAKIEYKKSDRSDLKIEVSYTLKDGTIQKFNVGKNIKPWLDEFSLARTEEDQRKLIQEIGEAAQELQTVGASVVDHVKLKFAFENILGSKGRNLSNSEIFDKIGRQTLTADQKNKLTINPAAKYRDPHFVAMMEEATDFITTYLEGDAAPIRGIKLEKLRAGARAYASGNTINLAPDTNTSVFIHESAHVIHDYNKNIEDLVREFFRDRTAGEKLTPIYAGRKEMGFKDDFFNHYVGKVYDFEKSNPGGTEVLSMGLQEMFKDPINFYKKDPDYFTLVYSVMRGLY